MSMYDFMHEGAEEKWLEGCMDIWLDGRLDE
jgi:hypothetical protein